MRLKYLLFSALGVMCWRTSVTQAAGDVRSESVTGDFMIEREEVGQGTDIVADRQQPDESSLLLEGLAELTRRLTQLREALAQVAADIDDAHTTDEGESDDGGDAGSDDDDEASSITTTESVQQGFTDEIQSVSQAIVQDNSTSNTSPPKLPEDIDDLEEDLDTDDQGDITTTIPPKYLPCEPPFEEIAYRMCILQETEVKMTWAQAWAYCWKQGAELAQDDVVIKARRYLNDLYGEYGSRTRWPVWVGAKVVKDGEERVWKWAKGTTVPNFLWTEGQPRHYGRVRAPDGVCMFLDGYKSFYAASLPCHLRRRFVCQRRE